MLDRLKARIARAQQDIAAANPIEDEERDVARSIIDPDGHEPRGAIAGVDGEIRSAGPALLMVDLRGEAGDEVRRLGSARALTDASSTRALVALDATGPWAARARLGRSRLRLGGRVLAILRIDAEDGGGRLVDGPSRPSIGLTHRNASAPIA